MFIPFYIFLEFLTQFDKFDEDNDTRLTVNESRLPESVFNMLDVDKDTFITTDEIQKQIAYLQIKLETPQTDTSAINKTSNISELSTNKTEPLPLIEATSILPTNETQPHTGAVPSASHQSIVVSSNPGLNSASVTVIPTSTVSSSTMPSPPTPSILDDLEAQLQEFSDLT